MIKEIADRLAIRVLVDMAQRLRLEAEMQDNPFRAAELNRLASVLEQLRNEEENLITRRFEKPNGPLVNNT
jgi:hypothetical protein